MERDEFKERHEGNHPEEGQAGRDRQPASSKFETLDRSDTGLYETDTHMKLINFNDAFCEIVGHSRETLQSESLLNFVDKRFARMVYQAFTKAYVKRVGFKDLLWIVHDAKGANRIIESSAGLIINERGGKSGFRGTARDVTKVFTADEAALEASVRYQRQFRTDRGVEKRLGSLIDFVPYPMVVLDLDGKVVYLNPAFTRIFGWTLKEVRAKKIPYVPTDLQEETIESHKRLFNHKVLRRYETRRLTKDGRIRDVVMKGAVYTKGDNEPGGELIILRDVTEEKRVTRINEALLRISVALPKYPDLEHLLDYISSEVKQLLNTEGALVILLDEEKNELYYLGAAYENRATEERAKEIRFPANMGISGRVISTGEAVIVPDTSKDPEFLSVVAQKLGYHARNILDVPLKSGDRTIGILCASNKKEGLFDQKDVELLTMIAGTVALSIENARYAREINEAYEEVKSLNRAKDKAINHLSHELRTPIAVLHSTLNILAKNLTFLPHKKWEPASERAHRNLARITDIQSEVEDIMLDSQYTAYGLINSLLEPCVDELESLFAEEVGEGKVIEAIRSRIQETFGPKTAEISEIALAEFVQDRLKALGPQFSHRSVEIITRTDDAPDICIPKEVLTKVVDGLIRNAIENTPDEGTVEIGVQRKGTGCQLVVADYGVGITEDSQKRIFEGFYPTQETMAYSSKRPFDFNAGGKGADLLRMKIFAERFHFRIYMESSRCRFIPRDTDICPGGIRECEHCNTEEECHSSGRTVFTVFFPSKRDIVLEKN